MGGGQLTWCDRNKCGPYGGAARKRNRGAVSERVVKVEREGGTGTCVY